jgi:hypothetical protein
MKPVLLLTIKPVQHNALAPGYTLKGSSMKVFNCMFHVNRGSVTSAAMRFFALVSALVVSAAINPFQYVQAAIDETMPSAIPDSIIADWKAQDNIGTVYPATVDSIVSKLPAGYAEKVNAKKADLSIEKYYLLACHYRRVSRMKHHEADLENIMFARHHIFGGIEVGYHDNAEAANTDNAWTAKGALCVLEMKNYYSPYTEIYSRSDAVVRDPCVSFDGKKALCAISGKGKGTGYKIYEMTISGAPAPTQLTFDPESLGVVADFEPCYLPDGDIMFTSTRNFGMTGDGFQCATNMFLMNGQGKCMRRVGFDQANTFYPVLMDDGTVIYTRWEFNDRSLVYTMGLFVMNPDGCRQTEYFGNQTRWPFTQIHARPIPGTHGAKVMCLAGGIHGPYAGELMIIDRSNGVDGAAAIRFIAPVRNFGPATKKSDIAMGDVVFTAQNPYPLDENDFLVSWRKSETVKNYQLYFMNIDGSRELLAWTAMTGQSLSQPVPMKPRESTPPKVAKQANWKDSTAAYTMQNVYIGAGMEGMAKGIAKSLRVIKITYRVSGAGTTSGMTMGSGPSGTFTPAISCPVSYYGGSWEAKEVLGEAKIFEDGSAAFKVPARTPVYFQVIDSTGYCIASMRSWSTLMPGETFSCVGCHENKLTTPPPTGRGLCGSPKPLEAPLGIENKPFDYKLMVQPIFDAKCVKCHTAGHESGFDLSGDLSVSSASKKWTVSYTSLMKGLPAKSSNDAVNLCTIFSEPEQQPPYSFGSSLSGIMTKGGMSGSHHEVQVTETERKIVACWIDLCAPHAGKYNSYLSAMDSTRYEKLLDKRVKWAAIEKENIGQMLVTIPVNPHEPGNLKFARSITEQLHIVYASTKRALILKEISRGDLKLLDLRGRVIYHIKLPDPHIDGEATVSLPAPLSMGLYVARFECVNGILQAKISITE